GRSPGRVAVARFSGGYSESAERAARRSASRSTVASEPVAPVAPPSHMPLRPQEPQPPETPQSEDGSAAAESPQDAALSPPEEQQPDAASASADFFASYSAMVWEPMAAPTPSMVRPSSTATTTHSHIQPEASGWIATNDRAAEPKNPSADTAHGGPAMRCVMSQFSLDLRASGARMPIQLLPGSFADHASPATTAMKRATTRRITGNTIMVTNIRAGHGAGKNGGCSAAAGKWMRLGRGGPGQTRAESCHSGGIDGAVMLFGG